MNLPKTSFLHRDIIKQHKVFTAIVVLQCLVILWLLVGLFRPAFSLTILPQDFSAAVEEKSDSQYQVQMSGESLQFQVAEEAKRAPESEGEANFEQLESQGHAIRSGAYEVTIQYQTDSTSANIRAAEVSFEELEFTNLVFGDAITLTGARNSLAGRLWVSLGADAKDVVVRINPLGECNFQIERIILREEPIYRVVRLVGFILMCLLLNGVGLVLFTENKMNPLLFIRKHGACASLFVVCVFACLPLFDSCLQWAAGEDFTFHLTRIVSLAQGLSEGQFPVRLYTDMLNGYGYATPLYYCDLFLYIPALLYNCMLPLQWCYKIYVFAVTIVTGAICYYTLRQLVLTKQIAVACTAIYLLSGYRFCNVYFRGAVGEYTAMMWLPLIVLGIYRLYKDVHPNWKSGLPLAIGIAGLAQCHVLTLEMTLLFLVIFCLLNIRKTFKKERFYSLFKLAMISIGLSAWFAIPMLDSMATQEVLVSQPGGYGGFQGEATPLYELLTFFPNMETRSSHGTLGASLVCGTIIAALVLAGRSFWKEKNKPVFFILKYSLLLGAFSVLLASDVFPWSALFSHIENAWIFKALTVIQFPWRYLTMASILLVVAIAASLEIIRKYYVKSYLPVMIGLVMVAFFSSGMMFYTVYQVRQQTVEYDITENERDWIVTGEYLLSKDVDWNYPRPSTQDEELLIKWYDKTDGVAHITLDNTGDTEATVVLPIFDYGNYHAVDTEGTEWTLGTSENSLLQLTVPAGYSGSFSIQYKEPIWWRAAELVSLATFAGLVGIWLKDKKKKRQLYKLPGNLAG